MNRSIYASDSVALALRFKAVFERAVFSPLGSFWAAWATVWPLLEVAERELSCCL